MGFGKLLLPLFVLFRFPLTRYPSGVAMHEPFSGSFLFSLSFPDFMKTRTPILLFHSSIVLLAVLILFFGLPRPVFGLPFPGQMPGNKITPSDTADDDKFGFSVAVSGTYLLAGAVVEDGAGTDRGAAYLFDLSTGIELAKWTASDGEDNDQFGNAVAIDGRYAVVGAREEDGDGIDRGAAYVFDVTTGEELYKLVASDGADNDDFGYSVSITGSLVVVGATDADAGGGINSNRGAAYVFDLTAPVIPDGAMPNLLHENRMLIASDRQDHDDFGKSVSAAGNLVVVGANGEDGAGNNRGSAYVFNLLTGEQLYQLRSSDGEDHDNLGLSVAFSGDGVLLSSHGEDGEGNLRGAAYFYDLSEPNVSDPQTPFLLHETRKFTASDLEDEDRFSWSVAMEGRVALIGARDADGDGVNRGAAYLFDVTTGEEIEKLTAADADDNDRFGFFVAIGGGVAVVGAEWEDGAGASSAQRGAVYVYEVSHFAPDAIVGSRPFQGAGNDQYDTAGTGQSFAKVSKKLREVSAWVSLENDGNRPDDFLVSGSGGNSFFSASYFQSLAGRRSNTTAAMIAGTHLERNVTPGEWGRLVCLKVKPSGRLKKKKRTRSGKRRIVYLRKRFFATVRVKSGSQPSRDDAVMIRVSTR